MAHLRIGDNETHQLLRAESMSQRVCIEDPSELIISNGEIELKRVAIRSKGSWCKVNRR